MRKAKLKQGTLAWENARETRIGSSEVFDIVRYYATPEELHNCGINIADFKEESPYTTAWALYHKMIKSGFYQRAELPAMFAEYGHVLEPYGAAHLQRDRTNKVKRGEVFVTDSLIASLDTCGVAEQRDAARPFDVGRGAPKVGQKFVCEQKTMMPIKFKKGIPYKYIIQAQYQIMAIDADFFILQVMVLDQDDEFIRGKICAMSPKARKAYLDAHLAVHYVYFENNVALAVLIKMCLLRFAEAVEKREEPTPYIADDTKRNIIDSIRLNSFYNPKLCLPFDLSKIIAAKEAKRFGAEVFDDALQEIIETAKEHNASVFFDGINKCSASFSKSGSFLIKPMKGEK